MKTLGIIGGLGPMATACLLELLVNMTDAARDQDHLNAIVYHQPSIPDRTAYILGKSPADPLPPMRALAEKLDGQGVGCIIIPCNTAHYFYEDISRGLKAAFPHIIRETAAYLKRAGVKAAGVMATDGTIGSGLYQREFAAQGIQAVTPSPQAQKLVMSLIYDDIKAGRDGDPEKFAAIHRDLEAQGCDCGVLACTELSVFADKHHLPPFYTDAMAVLAERAVQACHRPLRTIFIK